MRVPPAFVHVADRHIAFWVDVMNKFPVPDVNAYMPDALYHIGIVVRSWRRKENKIAFAKLAAVDRRIVFVLEPGAPTQFDALLGKQIFGEGRAVELHRSRIALAVSVMDDAD